MSTPLSVVTKIVAEDAITQTPIKVLYDSRFPECKLFAEQSAKYGSNLCDFSGDVAKLWYEFTSQGFTGTLAGLTQESDFFLLHQMFKERGYRVGYRGEHTYNDSWIEHSLQSSGQVAPILSSIEGSIEGSLKTDGNKWARRIADIVVLVDSPNIDSSTIRSKAPLIRPPDSPGHLISWVLLPTV
ncbi:MAG: hypothetical protein DRQ47_10030 [Gammaproteobacteria bacterium]|nr:MAG: hypothetical protein DRQ47_10030 [Gammaproteobacteria bacterium]